MATGINIRLRSFAEYRPRKEIKHPHWFKCSNRILEDEDFYDFSFEEIAVWIYIMSIASQRDCDTVFINFEAAERKCRFKSKAILSAIDKLKVKQIDVLPAHDLTTACTRSDHDMCPRRIEGEEGVEAIEPRTDHGSVPTNFNEFYSQLAEETKKEHEALYPVQGYIAREAIKAAQWCERNPRKVPRSKNGWSRFFSGWLERGWEKERKNIPTNSGHVRSVI